jgi:hypothetical protein
MLGQATLAGSEYAPASPHGCRADQDHWYGEHTNAKGEFEGAITTSLGAEFVFSAGTSLAQPNFVFTYIPVGGSEQAVYTTGFAVIAR